PILNKLNSVLGPLFGIKLPVVVYVLDIGPPSKPNRLKFEFPSIVRILLIGCSIEEFNLFGTYGISSDDIEVAEGADGAEDSELAKEIEEAEGIEEFTLFGLLESSI